MLKIGEQMENHSKEMEKPEKDKNKIVIKNVYI